LIAWFIIATDHAKERRVVTAMTNLRLMTFLPLAVQSRRVARHTKRREVWHCPLIPRLIFVRCEHGDLNFIAQARNVRRIARDAQGLALSISEAEMARFMEGHAMWLLRETKRHSKGELRKPRKPLRGRSLQDIRGLFDSLAEENERVDPETGEIFERAA
jgi:transcription antitermination factor NusG